MYYLRLTSRWKEKINKIKKFFGKKDALDGSDMNDPHFSSQIDVDQLEVSGSF